MGSPRNTTSVRALPAEPPIATYMQGLAELYPDAHVELDHRDGYQLLCATILAAQSTDKMINTITPALFARYPDAAALAKADPAELEPLIYKSGFFRNKAKALIGMARALVERHGGRVPDTMDELVALPGVARKTSNVILWTVFRKNEGFIVDTHVTRLAQRLGLTRHTDPVKIEQDLMRIVPRDEWGRFADRLIWHGRRMCFARNPACPQCPLAPVCPSAEIPGRAAPPKLKPAVKKTVKKTVEKVVAKPAAKQPSRKPATKAAKPKAGAKPTARPRR